MRTTGVVLNALKKLPIGFLAAVTCAAIVQTAIGFLRRVDEITSSTYTAHRTYSEIAAK
jgi:hypothetical protein